MEPFSQENPAVDELDSLSSSGLLPWQLQFVPDIQPLDPQTFSNQLQDDMVGQTQDFSGIYWPTGVMPPQMLPDEDYSTASDSLPQSPGSASGSSSQESVRELFEQIMSDEDNPVVQQQAANDFRRQKAARFPIMDARVCFPDDASRPFEVYTCPTGWTHSEFCVVSENQHCCCEGCAPGSSPTVSIMASEWIPNRHGKPRPCAVPYAGGNKIVAFSLSNDFVNSNPALAQCALVSSLPTSARAVVRGISYECVKISDDQAAALKGLARLLQRPSESESSQDPLDFVDLFQLACSRGISKECARIDWFLHVTYEGHDYRLKFGAAPQDAGSNKPKKRSRPEPEAGLTWTPVDILKNNIYLASKKSSRKPPHKRQKMVEASEPLQFAARTAPPASTQPFINQASVPILYLAQPTAPLVVSSSPAAIPSVPRFLPVRARDEYVYLSNHPMTISLKYLERATPMNPDSAPQAAKAGFFFLPNSGDPYPIRDDQALPQLIHWSPQSSEFCYVQFPPEWLIWKELAIYSLSNRTEAPFQSYVSIKSQINFLATSQNNHYNISSDVYLQLRVSATADPSERAPKPDHSDAGAEIRAALPNLPASLSLHCFAGSRFDVVVDKLLERGCDPMVKLKSGLTPLHVAAWRGSLSVILVLLKWLDKDKPKLRTALESQDKWGNTPLDIATFQHRSDVVYFLDRYQEKSQALTREEAIRLLQNPIADLDSLGHVPEDVLIESLRLDSPSATLYRNVAFALEKKNVNYLKSRDGIFSIVDFAIMAMEEDSEDGRAYLSYCLTEDKCEPLAREQPGISPLDAALLAVAYEPHLGATFTTLGYFIQKEGLSEVELLEGDKVSPDELYQRAIAVDHYPMAYNNLAYNLANNGLEYAVLGDGRKMSPLQLYVHALKCQILEPYAYFNLARHVGPDKKVQLLSGIAMNAVELISHAPFIDKDNEFVLSLMIAAAKPGETITWLDATETDSLRLFLRKETLEAGYVHIGLAFHLLQSRKLSESMYPWLGNIDRVAQLLLLEGLRKSPEETEGYFLLCRCMAPKSKIIWIDGSLLGKFEIIELGMQTADKTTTFMFGPPLTKRDLWKMFIEENEPYAAAFARLAALLSAERDTVFIYDEPMTAMDLCLRALEVDSACLEATEYICDNMGSTVVLPSGLECSKTEFCLAALRKGVQSARIYSTLAEEIAVDVELPDGSTADSVELWRRAVEIMPLHFPSLISLGLNLSPNQALLIAHPDGTTGTLTKKSCALDVLQTADLTPPEHHHIKSVVMMCLALSLQKDETVSLSAHPEDHSALISKVDLFIHAFDLGLNSVGYEGIEKHCSRILVELSQLTNMIKLKDGRVLSRREMLLEAIHIRKLSDAYYHLAKLLEPDETIFTHDGKELSQRELYMKAIRKDQGNAAAMYELSNLLEEGETLVEHLLFGGEDYDEITKEQLRQRALILCPELEQLTEKSNPNDFDPTTKEWARARSRQDLISPAAQRKGLARSKPLQIDRVIANLFAK
eukprot:TRINITY_DN5080_c0_g1_i1.p1 TRINITY_DN5080_c0_g1~~TRINITY_DN5080_c0_g1_i1.p1  ORF type:complete len:1505 (+),score=190.59 TRINITY_DN5080_c0_g1_i1:69-4583(+)